jgi:hypothetical protein
MVSLMPKSTVRFHLMAVDFFVAIDRKKLTKLFLLFFTKNPDATVIKPFFQLSAGRLIYIIPPGVSFAFGSGRSRRILSAIPADRWPAPAGHNIGRKIQHENDPNPKGVI